MQLLVPITVIASTPIVKVEEDIFVTTIFLDLINRQTFNIIRNAPEVIDAAILTGRLVAPGINHTIQVTPLVRQEKVFGDLIEEFHLELTITSDVLHPQDLLPEPDCDIIQLA